MQLFLFSILLDFGLFLAVVVLLLLDRLCMHIDLDLFESMCEDEDVVMDADEDVGMHGDKHVGVVEDEGVGVDEHAFGDVVQEGDASSSNVDVFFLLSSPDFDLFLRISFLDGFPIGFASDFPGWLKLIQPGWSLRVG